MEISFRSQNCCMYAAHIAYSPSTFVTTKEIMDVVPLRLLYRPISSALSEDSSPSQRECNMTVTDLRLQASMFGV